MYKEKTDFHAHSTMSDGRLSISQSLERRKNYAKVLGISDHYLAIQQKQKWEQYILEILRNQELLEGQIAVKIGIEIFFDDLRNDFDNIRFGDLDYLIVERFEYQSIDEITPLLKELRACFEGDIIMAHPDFNTILFVNGENSFYEFLCLLRELRICIEINTNRSIFFDFPGGFKFFLNRKGIIMDNLNKAGSYVSIGTDAHSYKEQLFTRFTEIWTYLENDYKKL